VRQKGVCCTSKGVRYATNRKNLAEDRWCLKCNVRKNDVIQIERDAICGREREGREGKRESAYCMFGEVQRITNS